MSNFKRIPQLLSCQEKSKKGNISADNWMDLYDKINVIFYKIRQASAFSVAVIGYRGKFYPVSPICEASDMGKR